MGNELFIIQTVAYALAFSYNDAEINSISIWPTCCRLWPTHSPFWQTWIYSIFFGYHYYRQIIMNNTLDTYIISLANHHYYRLNDANMNFENVCLEKKTMYIGWQLHLIGHHHLDIFEYECLLQNNRQLMQSH